MPKYSLLAAASPEVCVRDIIGVVCVCLLAKQNVRETDLLFRF